jgi:hypothetical protein
VEHGNVFPHDGFVVSGLEILGHEVLSLLFEEGEGENTDGIIFVCKAFPENSIGLGAPLILRNIERIGHQDFSLEERQRRYTSSLPDCDTSTPSCAKQRACSHRSKYCAGDATLGTLKRRDHDQRRHRLNFETFPSNGLFHH